MENKKPGLTDKNSPKALDADIEAQNPIALALKRKRKMMASARGSAPPALDSFGQVTLEPQEGDQS